jgi:HEAT repeat protein
MIAYGTIDDGTFPPEHLGFLLGLAKDSDQEIRSSVLSGVRRLRDARAIETLQHVLRSGGESAEVREAALAALVGMSAIAPGDVAALHPGNRGAALTSLQFFRGDPRAITIATEVYLNPAEDPDLRGRAAAVLAEIGGLPEPFRTVAMSPEATEKLRLQALDFLGRTAAASRDPRIGADLTRLFVDPRQGTRLRIAALRAARDVKNLASEVVWRLLADKDPEIQLAAIDLIRTIAPAEEGQERFRALFQQGVTDPRVRLQVFRLGYGNPGRERFIDELLAALGDPQEEIGREATAQLCGMASEQRVRAALRSSLRSRDRPSSVRSAAARVLATCSAPAIEAQREDLDAIFSLLASGNGRAWSEAFEAMGAFGDARSIPFLDEVLHDPASPIGKRSGALWALSGLGSPACPLLIEAFEGPDEALRYEVDRDLTYVAESGELSDAAVRSVIASVGRGGLGSWSVRHLVSWGDLRAVDPLIVELARSNEKTTAFLNQALVQITGVDFGLDASAWRAWRETAGAPGRGPATQPDLPTPGDQEFLAASDRFEARGQIFRADVQFYRDSMPRNPPGLNAWFVTAKILSTSGAAVPDDLLVDRLWFQEGDRVVTSANFLIDSESSIKAALQSFAPSPPSSAAPRGAGPRAPASPAPRPSGAGHVH